MSQGGGLTGAQVLHSFEMTTVGDQEILNRKAQAYGHDRNSVRPSLRAWQNHPMAETPRAIVHMDDRG